MKKLTAALLILIFVCSCAFGSPIEPVKSESEAVFEEGADLLTIRFFNTHTASDCFLLTYGGRNMLIDCSEDYIAERDLIPHIKALGVEQLDYVVNTHPHDDHIDGFAYFADSFPIGAFYTCFPLDENAEQKRAVAAANAHGIPVIKLNDQDTIDFPGLTIRTYSDENKHGLNGASMVLHISYMDSALLLLADTEPAAQKNLNLVWGESSKCDIVKLAHHGLNLPSFTLMQNALPRLAVITNRHTSGTNKSIQMVHNVKCADIRFTMNGDLVCVTDGTVWKVWQEWD